MISAKAENNNNEWYTPKYIISKVKEVFDGEIDLDPCSTLKANQRVMAKNYFTKECNCLTKDWHGRIFMNPPYSANLLSKVLIKAVEEYDKGNAKELIVLTNSGTDTKWNQLLKDGLQAYTIGRVRFIYPSGIQAGVPSRGQVFTYYGENKNKFIEAFTKDNFCWIPNKTHIKGELKC